MQKKIILIFAFDKEAHSTIHQSKIKFIKEKKDVYKATYNTKEIFLIICGIGRKAKEITNARIAEITGYSGFVELIIKAGTCAVIDKSIDTGKPLIPSNICYSGKQKKIDFLKFNSNLLKIINTYKTDKTILTIDAVLKSESDAIELFNEGFSFVDMETFFLYENLGSSPFMPVLIGTDRGDIKAIFDFLKAIKKASELLKNIIIEIIEAI